MLWPWKPQGSSFARELFTASSGTVATVKRLYDDKKLIIAKGLASKVMDTSAGGQDRRMTSPGATAKHCVVQADMASQDSGALQWVCEECKEAGFVDMVQKKDQEPGCMLTL